MVILNEVMSMINNSNNASTIDGLRNDLLDVIISLQNDPATASAINGQIDKLSQKKRTDVLQLINNRRNDVETNGVEIGYSSNRVINRGRSRNNGNRYHNFSFAITGFEIVMLLAGLIVAVLQLPNFGLRVANLLRDKFKISHESQLRLIRVIDLIGNVAPKAMTALVAINSVVESQAARAVDKSINFKSATKLASGGTHKYKFWVTTYNNLYRNKATRPAVIRAIQNLESGQDKFIAKNILRILGHTVTFSDVSGDDIGINDSTNVPLTYDRDDDASFVNYARIMISRSRSSMGDSLAVSNGYNNSNLEVTHKMNAWDVIRTIIHIIVNMLANPGVSMIVIRIIRRTLPFSLFTELLLSAGLSGGAILAKSVLDKVQKIKDATYGTL